MQSTSRDARPVVVGFDGSPDSCAALRWAVADASASDSLLQVVVVADATAVPPRPVQDGPAGTPRPVEPFDTRRAEESLAAARALAATTSLHRGADVAVDTVISTGGVVPALLEHSGRARLLAVGARGAGHEYCPAWGETAIAVSADASVPVLVAHAGPDVFEAGARPRVRVLVALSGEPCEDDVLRTGLDVAQRFDGTLHVLSVPTGPPSSRPPDWCQLSALSPDGEVLTSESFTDGEDALRRAVARADVVVTRADGRAAVNGLLPTARLQALFARLSRPVIAVPAARARAPRRGHRLAVA